MSAHSFSSSVAVEELLAETAKLMDIKTVLGVPEETYKDKNTIEMMIEQVKYLSGQSRLYMCVAREQTQLYVVECSKSTMDENLEKLAKEKTDGVVKKSLILLIKAMLDKTERRMAELADKDMNESIYHQAIDDSYVTAKKEADEVQRQMEQKKAQARKDYEELLNRLAVEEELKKEELAKLVLEVEQRKVQLADVPAGAA